MLSEISFQTVLNAIRDFHPTQLSEISFYTVLNVIRDFISNGTK